MESNVVLATEKFDVVGTRPIRHDGTDKVTGRAQYGADVHLPGLLYGAVLRSPHAHARIKSIDTSGALAIPGVKAVATASDLPQPSGETADLGEGRDDESQVPEQQRAGGGEGAVQGARSGRSGRRQPTPGRGGAFGHSRRVRGAAGSDGRC